MKSQKPIMPCRLRQRLVQVSRWRGRFSASLPWPLLTFLDAVTVSCGPGMLSGGTVCPGSDLSRLRGLDRHHGTNEFTWCLHPSQLVDAMNLMFACSQARSHTEPTFAY